MKPGWAHSAITKYTMTCGGSFPPRLFADLPAASTASPTMSRSTHDASTPREIQSLSRPATHPVCSTNRDHDAPDAKPQAEPKITTS